MSPPDTRGRCTARRVAWLVVALLTIVHPRVRAADAATFGPCFEGVKQRLRANEGSAVLPDITRCEPLAADAGERWRLVLARALAHQQGGALVLAREHYQAFLAASEASDEAEWVTRRAEVTRVIGEIEATLLLSHVRLGLEASPIDASATITTTGPTATVVFTGPLPWSGFVPPGTYRIAVRRAQFVPFETLVRLAAGERRTIQTTLERERVVEPEPEPEPEPVAPDVAPDRSAAWVVGTLGVVGMATGAVFTGLALGDAATLRELQRETPSEAVVREDRRARSRLGDRETASWVCYGVGAAALVGAVVLWVTASPDVGAQVTPLGGAPGAMVTMRF